jgi:hypothetical protein
MLLGTAAHGAKMGRETAGPRALTEAQATAEQAAALLAAVTGTPAGRLAPCRSCPPPAVCALSRRSPARLATGLSRAAAALGRGDGPTATAVAVVAAGRLGPLIATLAGQRRAAGRRPAA